MGAFGRFLWTLFLAIAGLVGLGMSLCGGIVLLPSLNSGVSWLFPLGVLGIGVLICYGAWRGLTRMGAKDRDASSQDQAHR